MYSSIKAGIFLSNNDRKRSMKFWRFFLITNIIIQALKNIKENNFDYCMKETIYCLDVSKNIYFKYII